MDREFCIEVRKKLVTILSNRFRLNNFAFSCIYSFKWEAKLFQFFLYGREITNNLGQVSQNLESIHQNISDKKQECQP